jgi:23S rRNA (guanosine2251-2'-O)-methyltransferase
MNRKLKLQELNRSSVEEFKATDKLPIIVVLDNIRSLSNVGSIFRCSDSFGIDAIYLCGITPRPPHREITKTAIGATLSVDWKYFERTEDAVAELRGNGHQIVSIEQTESTEKLGSKIFTSGKYAIVMGNEVEGVQQAIVDLSDYCLEIDQFGTKHSLNVSVCTGIVLFEISRQLRAVN